jgi:hypothetical protein
MPHIWSPPVVDNPSLLVHSCAGRVASAALARSWALIQDIFARFLLLTPFLFFSTLLWNYFLHLACWLFLSLLPSVGLETSQHFYYELHMSPLIQLLEATWSWLDFSAKSHPRSVLHGFPDWGIRCITYMTYTFSMELFPLIGADLPLWFWKTCHVLRCAD